MKYTSNEIEVLLHNLSARKGKVMVYTEKELETLINNLIRKNKNLIYLHNYINKKNQIRFVFRDKHYNNFELDARNNIVKHDIE